MSPSNSLKFLLINPAAPQWRVLPGTVPPLSTRIFRFSMLTSLYVAAAMPRMVETYLLDEEVEPVDFDTDADLIGISFMTFNAPRAYEIADKFREKGKTVFLGGYHPTFMPQEAIAHADAVCIGEAEPSVPRMIADFLAGRLQQFYQNGLADLSRLQPLNRKLVTHGVYVWADTVQASRGCRQQCTFCSIASFFGNQFRSRPVDDVIAELKSLGKQILFMDDCITTDPDYAKELFSKMIPLKKHWYSQCNINIADDEELLRLAVQSGCKGLFIGLESLSQENLQAWKKNNNRSNNYRKSIEKLHNSGIGVFAGIVFGNEWDTPQVFPRTLEFLLECNIDALQATILTPFPGTPLFKNMADSGRIFDKDWSHYDFRHVVFEPLKMSRETLQAGHDWVLSHFYSKAAVTSRLLHEFRYMSPGTISRVTLPLNFAYRQRLRKDGTWNTDAEFEEKCKQSPIVTSGVPSESSQLVQDK